MTKLNNNEVKNGATINSVKSLILRAGGRERPATNALGSLIRDPQIQEIWDDKQQIANRIIAAVKDGNFGFASDIAATIAKYGKVSEKQAYWIARTAWENDLDALFCEEEGMASIYAQER